MYKKLLFLLILCFLINSITFAESIEENIAYKLAVFHAQNITTEPLFLAKKIIPPDAMITEFQWILDSMKNRSFNTEETIANTIIETWTSLKENGISMSILEVARELSLITRNTRLFGHKKINFRMTSRYWLLSKLTNSDIEDVIKSNPFKK